LHSLLSLRLNTRQDLSIIENGVLIAKTERLVQARSRTVSDPLQLNPQSAQRGTTVCMPSF
jgi:hypothetical protein